MSERFTRFTMTISRLNKLIQKLKTDGMSLFGLKGVDTLCLYQLSAHESMTFSELVHSCQIDQALVSRTLRDLVSVGMVAKSGAPGKYNAKYALTAQGLQRTSEIRSIIEIIQHKADQGITTEELATFYRVLSRLTKNFEEMAQGSPDMFSGDTLIPIDKKENIE